MSSIGVSIGSVLFCWILYAPGRSNVRRIIGMIADYGLMSMAMALMGEPLSWLYVIMMWVTVGNGLRYGNRFLAGAVSMAAIGFAVVLFTNTYWENNLSLGIGLNGNAAADAFKMICLGANGVIIGKILIQLLGCIGNEQGRCNACNTGKAGKHASKAG